MSSAKHPTQRKIHKVACSQCHGTLTLRAAGHINTLICEYCGADYQVDATGKLTLRTLAIKKKANPKKAYVNPLIPLGAIGKLHGAKWEVIGYLKRRESYGRFEWEEYLLFNPYKGYRWLTNSQGHWNYVCILHSVPNVSYSRATYLKRTFPFSNEYTGSNLAVAGEFYWEVKIGRPSKFKEYIATPSILTKETLMPLSYQKNVRQKSPYLQSGRKTLTDADMLPISATSQHQQPLYPKAYSTLTDYGNKTDKPLQKQPTSLEYSNEAIEEIWSISDYMEPEAVKAAFNLKTTLPTRNYIAENQPFALQSYLKPMLMIGGIFCGLMLLVTIFLSSSMQSKYYLQDSMIVNQLKQEVVDLAYPVQSHQYRYSYTSPSFKLLAPTGIDQFLIDTDVYNAWVEIDASIINDQTGDTFYFFESIEFYAGYDSDGHWTQGSRSAKTEFSRLPAGIYHIQFDILTNNQNTHITYELREGVWSFYNFIFALTLGLLPCGYIMIRKYLFDSSKEQEED